MSGADDKITQLRDPLFVINTSLEIIKNRSSDEKINPELQRIKAALEKIDKIIS
jgi:capsule polysaccharide export protein KpsE/RkpR